MNIPIPDTVVMDCVNRRLAPKGQLVIKTQAGTEARRKYGTYVLSNGKPDELQHDVDLHAMAMDINLLGEHDLISCE